MITLKKLFFIGIITSATGIAQAVSMQNFDSSILDSYIIKAQADFNKVVGQIKYDDHGSQDIMWRRKTHAKTLYPALKAALKVTLKELKHNALYLKETNKAAWLPARQLYKAFKHNVYRNWKKTFKMDYKRSRNCHEPFAWSWLYSQVVTVVHKDPTITLENKLPIPASTA